MEDRKNTIIFVQDGNSITGEYRRSSPEELGGIFEGTVSDDGKTLFTTRTGTETVTFTLSDDGMRLVESDCGEKEIVSGDYCLNLTRMP